MSNIIKSAYTYGQQVISNMWNGRGVRKYGDSWFYPINVGTFNQIENLKSFLDIPEVNAVITRKATGYSNGIFKVVNMDGVEKKNDAVNKRLGKPNWFQSQKEFMMQTCLFHEIFGDEVLFMYTGMKRPTIDNLSAIYTLPPNLVTIEYGDTLPFFLFGADEQPDVNYQIDVNGRKYDLDPAKIIHLNENRVNIKDATDKNLLRGTSQLQTLRPAINNLRMAYNSRGAILKYRGALGMMTPDNKDAMGKAIALEEPEVNEIQKRYSETYGGLENQFQIFISNVPLKWQQMGVNPDKLGLYKETDEDFRKIKDAYQAPDELFASEKGSTYENQNEAWKRWYESCIIPDANERLGALNDVLMADSNFKIVVDYSHLPIFQEDVSHRADALGKYVNALSALRADQQITNDEYREELQKRFEIGDGKPVVVEADIPPPTTDPNTDPNQNTNE